METIRLKNLHRRVTKNKKHVSSSDIRTVTKVSNVVYRLETNELDGTRRNLFLPAKQGKTDFYP